jgi:hypothetical protein
MKSEVRSQKPEVRSQEAGADGRLIGRFDRVEKVGGDYTFVGQVVAVFDKLPKDDLMRRTRYVVEDDRGVLHIYSAKNLRVKPQQ